MRKGDKVSVAVKSEDGDWKVIKETGKTFDTFTVAKNNLLVFHMGKIEGAIFPPFMYGGSSKVPCNVGLSST